MSEWPQQRELPSTFLGEDERWVRFFTGARGALAGVAAVVSGAVLAAWLLFDVEHTIGNEISQPNSALSLVLLAVALLVFHRRPLVSAVIAVVPVLLATSAIIAHLRGHTTVVETWAFDHPDVPGAGLMRIFAAIWILVAAGLIVAAGVIVSRQVSGRVPLTVVSGATATLLIFSIGIFGEHAVNLIGLLLGEGRMLDRWQSNYGLMLLLLAWVATWIIDGQWRPLVGHGMSAAALRWLMFAAVAIPVVPATVISSLAIIGVLSPVTAISVLVACVVAGGLLIALSVFRQLRRLERVLVHQAMADAMTGLWNLGAFRRLADRQLANARRRGEDATLVVIDLDGLKKVNDSLGHAAGSEMIVAFSQALLVAAREEDVVARTGGDEFAVMLRGDAAAAEAVLRRLRGLVDDLNARGEHLWTLDFSAGSCTAARGRGVFDEMMMSADAAMYVDKQSKPGRASEPWSI